MLSAIRVREKGEASLMREKAGGEAAHERGDQENP